MLQEILTREQPLWQGFYTGFMAELAHNVRGSESKSRTILPWPTMA